MIRYDVWIVFMIGIHKSIRMIGGKTLHRLNGVCIATGKMAESESIKFMLSTDFANGKVFTVENSSVAYLMASHIIAEQITRFLIHIEAARQFGCQFLQA